MDLFFYHVDHIGEKEIQACQLNNKLRFSFDSFWKLFLRKVNNSNDTDKLFGFGAGSHRCIGENLMMHVLKYVAKYVINNLKWTHSENPMERNIKCLPILRPRHLEPVILTRKIWIYTEIYILNWQRKHFKIYMIFENMLGKIDYTSSYTV